MPKPKGRPRKSPAPPPPGDDADAQIAHAFATAIDAAMDERGFDADALAAASGVSAPYIRSLRRGDQTPRLPVAMRLASALDLPLAALTGAVTYPHSKQATTIPIRGGASHGAWKSMALDESPRGAAADVVPLDERFAAHPRFAIEVEDDSLMGLAPLPILRGYMAVVADLSGAAVDVEAGRVYFVARTLDGKINTAFWRITVYRKGLELVPLWADAAKNADGKISVSWEEYDRGDAIQILGILLGSTMRVV